MPLKCVETIYRLPQVGKEIVHPVGKPSDKVHHQHHHRNGHRLGNPSEPAPSNRGRSDHNRCSHVRWAEGLTLLIPGIASNGGGSGRNIPGASFPIWSTIAL